MSSRALTLIYENQLGWGPRWTIGTSLRAFGTMSAKTLSVCRISRVWGILRSAVSRTHVLRSRLVMNYTTSYFPLIVLGYLLYSKLYVGGVLGDHR